MVIDSRALESVAVTSSRGAENIREPVGLILGQTNLSADQLEEFGNISLPLIGLPL